MEADWEVELSDDAPVIDAAWPGRIDLQRFPDRVVQIPEVRLVPVLAELLVRLNHPRASPVSTSKCDVWSVDAIDPDELDAPHEAAQAAVACYIDLLPRSDQQWPFLANAVADSKALCARMHPISLPSCRVDLIIRRAIIAPERNDLGITAYVTACGPTSNDANNNLASALRALADALVPVPTVPSTDSPLQ